VMATDADSGRAIFEKLFRRKGRGPLTPAECNDIEYF